MKIVLDGVCGSRAYGLDNEGSDIDTRGVYVAKTEEILGLNPPPEVVDKKNPDVVFYEVGKFVRLALKGNPNILEMLYLPVYEGLTWEGELLINNRDKFLSKVIYNSYAGYAVSQAHKLNARAYSPLGKHKRYDKHSRHCFRLLKQGKQLLQEGTLTVRVDNREELFALGELSVDDLTTKFETEFKAFKEIVSVLPDEPDYAGINALLLEIRRANY